jgi:catechol 2,3-dioxygenase-like lactoylglutathione lyase family enzyme
MASSALEPQAGGLARSDCLIVRDLERSLDWYEAAFGFRPTRRVDLPAAGLRVACAEAGGLVIELCEPARRTGGGRSSPADSLAHRGAGQVSFTVADARAALRAAEARGLNLVWGIADNAPLGMRAFLLRDPDGHVVELLEALPGEG